ncbi:hypothetical protein TrRE_jg7258 [Triparma retinervis]|uniref:IMP-specific 5'-nucleotidase 1 n=1 Tax=Triparma retinervis TaxID=2557542 RepID=A0A9W6Z6G8_9STRA|nr:hypothetical protein TrRE_jg7258 [Triparma retinervis]
MPQNFNKFLFQTSNHFTPNKQSSTHSSAPHTHHTPIMSFSSRRRNYMLTSHRRDGLIEWMKSMLHHSFVLDMLTSTAPDTFSHFENLISEHRLLHPVHSGISPSTSEENLGAVKGRTSKLKQIRQILNLSQVMAVCGWSDTLPPPAPSNSDTPSPPRPFTGPDLVTFDGDQTLYSDGGNFESNPKLARALALMLKNGISIAVVTAAGYEYDAAKYTLRLTGLLKYFRASGLTAEECGRFYVMGGECNYLLRLDEAYELGPVKEAGPGGWVTSTKHLKDGPGNWSEKDVTKLLDIAEACLKEGVEEMKIRGRVIRKKRAVGLIPSSPSSISRENLDECALRVQSDLYGGSVSFSNLPYCAFNGGSDCWVDVGNKRVGVEILQAYLGLSPGKCLHVGDQFLNTGNDYAARGCAPCAWITSPGETTYILKRLLIFAGGINIDEEGAKGGRGGQGGTSPKTPRNRKGSKTGKEIDLDEAARRSVGGLVMDVYTGEMLLLHD